MDNEYITLQKHTDSIYTSINITRNCHSKDQQVDKPLKETPITKQWPKILLTILLILSLAANVVLAVFLIFKSTELHIPAHFQSSNKFLNKPTLDHCSHLNNSSLECTACPEGWLQHNKKCYFFSTDSMNWTASRDFCITLGGHLVIIESKAEQKFLETVLRSKEGRRLSYWIGLNDIITEGAWYWVNNVPLDGSITYWGKAIIQQPEDWKGENTSGEDCAKLFKYSSSIEWHDDSCQKEHANVCETVSGMLKVYM
ncbi:perlucin-like protein [Erpetoichthys calabaricus]|uniref:Perlucin-like protein n=1 Tax=Erpetoichthys calabaricus TaxID=27687 RepID=A0A8C4S2J1_ERPCA|nr:perlucin-like protein [Erpetoichthys calabaricus]